jgi:hypothetical protein
MAQKSKHTLKEMLEMIDAKIEHIEDINADSRAVIIKLVKQSNQIVEFLKNITIEEVDIDDYSIADMGMPSKKEQIDSERLSNINKFIKEYSANKKEMKLFEEELEELKDMITPGQVGEA